MKKWIFGIIVVSILSILFSGCTTVGAVNIPVDINDDEKQVENIPPDNIEDINKYLYYRYFSIASISNVFSIFCLVK